MIARGGAGESERRGQDKPGGHQAGGPSDPGDLGAGGSQSTGGGVDLDSGGGPAGSRLIEHGRAAFRFGDCRRQGGGPKGCLEVPGGCRPFRRGAGPPIALAVRREVMAAAVILLSVMMAIGGGEI